VAYAARYIARCTKIQDMKLSDEARLVLISLSSGAKHGYAIAEDVRGFSGRALGAGTLYGAIARLETRGFIEALAGDARRRPYRLTGAGAKAIRASLEDLRRVDAAARRRLAAR
jgi:DNA-binding PadR family transcriptional regulator